LGSKRQKRCSCALAPRLPPALLLYRVACFSSCGAMSAGAGLPNDDPDFAQLLEMGFEPAAIKSALASGGGFEAALPKLLESNAQHTECPPPQLASQQTNGELASLAPAAWLAAEGLQIEEKAAEFDRQGKSLEAAYHHRRASAKLAEASSLCPNGHQDKALLDGHAQDLATRAVYLQSLGGSPPEQPLENHVGTEIKGLALDLASGVSPTKQDISELLAGAGVSGSGAAITEDGFQMVAALRKDVEMRAYVLRVLEADWRRVKTDAEAEGQFTHFLQSCSGGAGNVQTDVTSLEQMRDRLRSAPWVDLNMDPALDRMQMGVDLEQQARNLDEQGRSEEAVAAYERALAVLQLVYKFDQRCKYPKVKDTVAKKIEDMLGRIQSLKGVIGNPG